MSGGRQYTDIITVGDTDIYNVPSNPNGVLQARLGSLAFQSTIGQPTIWKNIDGAMGWSSIEDAQPRRTFGRTPDLTTFLSIDASATFVEYTFAAPEDLTIKQIALALVAPQGLNDASYVLTVNGLGVDAGPDFLKVPIQGQVPATMFSAINSYPTPDINLRCPAGSTITLTLTNLFSGIVPFQVCFTYTPGMDLAQEPPSLSVTTFPWAAFSSL
jgi:hypothetical protein